VIAFLLTRVMRGLEKRLKAGVGKRPEGDRSKLALRREMADASAGGGTGVGGIR